MQEIDRKKAVVAILEEQNELLDRILSGQLKIRRAVNEKDWNSLERAIARIRDWSAEFVTLDTKREEIFSAADTAAADDVQPLLDEVRGKLVKSKIENKALSDYTNIVRGFVQGILEKVVPQRRNTLYSRSGTIVKPKPESVVINKLY